MATYPYKDQEINSWVYDSVPDKMEMATSPRQLPIGATILYRSTLGSLQGFYIAARVTAVNRECVHEKLNCGDVYVLKNGGSKKY